MLLIYQRWRGVPESGKATVVSQKNLRENHKLSGNITELMIMRQRFFHMFGEDYIFRITGIFLWIK
jgi:hypothetical protein